MRKYLCLLFLAATNFTVLSQNMYNAQWAGMDFGMMTTGRSDEWKNNIVQSSSFSLNIYEYKLPIFKQYLGLTTGLGINFKTFTFDDKYTLLSSDTSVSLAMGNPTLLDPSAEVRSSRLNLGYFQVPLLLDFSTKKREKKSFYLAAGVVGGIRMYANYNMRGKYADGDRFNNTLTDNKKFHSNLWNLEAMLRIGYGALGVYGSYNLTNLFDSDVAPNIAPIVFGFTVNVDYATEASKEEKVGVDF
ncbi:MAG: PorT family protein [Bacteroidetes bacterium]|nr:PorT family protein [Bacteroidota bacterium]